MRLSRIAFLACVPFALATTVAQAQEPRLEGVFALEGKDKLGKYGGDWTIAPVGTAVAIEADVRYESGVREVRHGRGAYVRGKLQVVYDRVERPRTPGVAGALYGEHENLPAPPPETLEALYTIGQDGRSAKGQLRYAASLGLVGAAGKFGSEELKQVVRPRTAPAVEACVPNLLPRPSVFPIPVKLRGKGFPTTRKLTTADVAFEAPGLVVKEILDQNPFGTEVTVALDVGAEAPLGPVGVKVAGSPAARLAEVAKVYRHVFICLADGTTNGEPFDEFNGDFGAESYVLRGPRDVARRAARGEASRRNARGLKTDLASYQVVECAKFDTFVVLNQRKLFLVKLIWNREEMIKAWGTKDAALVVDGHGHMGEGPTFAPPVPSSEQFTMNCDSPESDILKFPCRLKDFYYNGCWSGGYFTSTVRAVMPQGTFFYNRMMANAWWTTREFVRGIIEERAPADVVKSMATHSAGHEAGAPGFVRCADPIGPTDPDNPNRELLSVSTPEPNSEHAPRIFTPAAGWVRPQ